MPTRHDQYPPIRNIRKTDHTSQAIQISPHGTPTSLPPDCLTRKQIPYQIRPIQSVQIPYEISHEQSQRRPPPFTSTQSPHRFPGTMRPPPHGHAREDQSDTQRYHTDPTLPKHPQRGPNAHLMAPARQSGSVNPPTPMSGSTAFTAVGISSSGEQH